ncbi:MAG: hypothetical protein Q4P20_13235 [Eubacteriales bacterium]|nr:hypothetical protein [Eubacteriales bacterium]
MKERTYSMGIANAVTDFLTEDGWHFSFDEDHGIFRFDLSLKGKLKKVNYIVDIKDDEYLVYVISPIGADENDQKMMANMAEFICRANYGLKMGNFEVDFDDGEIRFKVHVLCKGITPTAAMIKRSLYCPATMFDHYGSGIGDIIFNDVSGKTAVEKCEKRSESEIRSILDELLDNEDETGISEESGMDAMVAHLAARFGITAGDEVGQSSEDTDNIEVHTDLFDKKGGTSA